MKKILALSLVAVLIFLAACSSDGSELRGKNLKGKDGSLLSLGKNSSFIWQLEPLTFEDPQYHGTYKIYQAKSAVSFLSENFADYELSEAAIYEKISERGCEVDAFYCIVFTNKEYLVEEINTLENEEEVVYYGYFFKAYGQLNLINVRTGMANDFTIVNY